MSHEPVAESERQPSEQPTLTKTSAPIGELDGLGVYAARESARLRALGALAAVVVAVIVVVLITNPFAGSGTANGGVSDNGTPISYATVNRESLSQQTQVPATLGYAGSGSILVPSGDSPSALQQSRQSLTSAEAQVASARISLASDTQALDALRASIAAAKGKAAVDCAGDNAGESASAASDKSRSGESSPSGENSSDRSPGGGSSPNSGSSPSGENSSNSSPGGSSPGSEKGNDGASGSGSTCASDQQSLASAEASLPQDQTKLESDRVSFSSAQASLANTRSSYATSRATATAYAQGAAYTKLPGTGEIIHRGEALFSIDGQPTVLLYGGTPATRAFILGMSPGGDVGELNANLEVLGYGQGLGGNVFSSATVAAIRAFQAAHGMPPTGELLLGSVVFWYGAERVTSVAPTLGSPVSPGPALSVTATTRVVTIQLDASQAGSVKAGDRVTITLPNNETTPGVVESVGTVAKTPSASKGGGEESAPTIEVAVRPTRPAATGRLDQAPVQVSITTQSVENVLSVPVTALLALAGGGYAVEEVGANGVHRLVAVSTGLFGTASGRVQVSGRELAVGQRVVVPAS
jgi:peptidoglycan hydrolase-like protein with peptidoglycan-binding domain